MDTLNCRRYCCRRMLMTHVDLIEKLLKYVPYKPCSTTLSLTSQPLLPHNHALATPPFTNLFPLFYDPFPYNLFLTTSPFL